MAALAQQFVEKDDTALNRRKHIRQPAQLPALVHPPRGRSWLCSIRDFCENGMLLVGNEGSRSLHSSGISIAAGDEVSLHFSVPTANNLQSYRLPARVVRVLGAGDGLGVFFAKALQREVFSALAASAAEQAAQAPVFSEPSVAELPDVHLNKPMRASRPDSGLSPDQAKELTQSIQALITRALAPLSQRFCEVAAQEMLISARDASSNDMQTCYFGGLSALETRAASFSEKFAAGIALQLQEVSDVEAVLERRRKRDASQVKSKTLQLVDTAEFEQWLVVAEKISKSETRFKEAVLDMRAQFGLIAKPWTHKDVIPVGPAAFWWAFDDAQQVFDFDDRLRKPIFTLFEDQLHQTLGVLYQELNQLFEAHQAMPALEGLRDELQPRVVRPDPADDGVALGYDQQVDPPVQKTPASVDVTSVGTSSQLYTRSSASGGVSAYERVRGILAGRAMAGESGLTQSVFGAAAPATEVYGAEEIFNALTALEQEPVVQGAARGSLGPRLINTLKAQFGENKGLSSDDLETLQVMQGLMDSLVEDPLITEGVRQWVQRLEITLNKLAAREPEFLASDSSSPHSAMQMLNQLARLGGSQDVIAGIDRNVGRRVDELLQRVVQEYDDNPDVFAETVKALYPLIDLQAKGYRSNLERTVRASEGQQKLQRARGAVVQAVGEIIADHDVPQVVLNLLNPGWRNLLVNTHLRQGGEGAEWLDRLAVISQLNRQMTGALGEGGQDYVEPEVLLRVVLEGLDSISFDPSKREPLIAQMSNVLVGDPTGQKIPPELVRVSPDMVGAVLGLSETENFPSESKHEEDPPEVDWTRWLERVRQLQVGDWLATSDRSGRPQLLSLGFVADDASFFVWVNRKGVKTLEYTSKSLALDLSTQRVKLLDDYELPLLERASQRMLDNLHQQLAFQATHDDLTQLINRKEFERRIVRAVARSKVQGITYALFHLDLDQFNLINNISGQDAGDALLRAVSAALVATFKGAAYTIARLGGDEFGLLTEGVETANVGTLVEKVRSTVSDTEFVWQGRPHSVAVSGGMVLIDQRSKDVNSVMQYVDEARHFAKDAGRNRIKEYEFDDESLIERHNAMQWVAQLDSALRENRLVLNGQKIQPVVDGSAGDRSQTHYEILLTLVDESGALVPPDEFIAAAETFNRMTMIDRWVIENLFQWMAENRACLDDFGGFSVNVSGASVNDASFPDFILEQMARTEVPTSKICFEITETVAIGNLDNAVDFMNRLRIVGCSFALDDFGTGLSSYSYLRNLPVDYVKIDGVFVKDMVDNAADHAVVRSINELSHHMGKLTIAEYVESPACLEALRALGVDYVQGFQISRPTPLKDLVIGD